ncbi:MAG: diguanylate cyclase [Firmicutes bacterium]|nr:diguanylate cyclase [Bacillota bacterium]
MAHFDIFTILIFQSLITLTFSFFIMHMMPSMKGKFQGLTQLMMGFLLYSIGVVLLAIREFLVAYMYLSILLGNLILFAGFIILVIGLKKLLSIHVNQKIYLLFYLTFCIVFYYFAVIKDDVAIRMILVSFFLLAAFVEAVYSMYIHSKKNNCFKTGSLLLMMIAYASIYFFRIILILLNYNTITDFLTYSIDIIFQAVGIVVLTAIFVLIMTIVNRMLTLEIEVKLEENKLLISELELSSKVDYLTGLYNRKSLREKTEELIEKCTETQSSFQYVLIDLNRFKEINDRYGHPFGDEVLIRFGDLLRNYTNLVFRYGGDEFILLLDNNHQDTQDMINLINSKCVHVFKKETFIPTFSYGIHVWQKGQTYDDLIKIVDQIMYQDKRNQEKSL